MALVDTKLCGFCGEERPAFALGETERPAAGNGILGFAGATTKRRYCTDRPECREQAETWRAAVKPL